MNISAPVRTVSRSSSSTRRPRRKSRCSSSARARSTAPMAARSWRWRPRRPARSASSRTAGTASTFCTPKPALPGALDVGFVPGEGGLDTGGMLKAGALDVLFLLGVDEVEVPAGPFVVYIGTHGDRGAHRADVILPGAAYPEKSGTLRQHRRPRADGQPRRVPAGRCPRGLGDPARSVRRARLQAALRHARRVAPGDLCGASASDAHRPDRAGDRRRYRGARASLAARRRSRLWCRRCRTSISPTRLRAPRR